MTIKPIFWNNSNARRWWFEIGFDVPITIKPMKKNTRKPSVLPCFLILDAVTHKVCIPAHRFIPRVEQVRVKRYQLPN